MKFVPVSALVLPVQLLIVFSCETAPALPPEVHATPSQVTDRASDGLLSNPLLQSVVEAQTARDAAALITFMHHADPLVRARAALGAASVQTPAMQPPLIRLLDDPDPRVRADAAFAVGQLGDTTVAGTLSATFKRETEVTAQSRMIEALGKVGTHNTLLELAALEPTRTAAPAVALAISRLGARDIHDPQSVEWVAKRLLAADPDLRMNSAYYFGRVPTSRPWALHAAYVRDALEDYALEEPAAMQLVLGLGRFHGADGRLLLHRLQHATDWRVRANTAAALAPLSSDPRVLDGLLTALDDVDHHVAANAAASLDWSEILEAEQLDRIELWIETHPDAVSVRGPLLGVLANRDRGDTVLRIARDTNRTTNTALSAIIPALGMVQSREAFDLLRQHRYSDDRQVRTAAITALGNRWARWRGAIDGTTGFYEIMAEVVRDGDTDNILAAASVIADPMFGDSAAELLSSSYAQLVDEHAPPGIVAEYVRRLNSHGASAIRQTLQDAARHPHPVVRKAVADRATGVVDVEVRKEEETAHSAERIDWTRLADLGSHPRLKLETTQGDVVIELFPEQAPRTVEHFVSNAMTGRYDGSSFHRVLPNFAVQAGLGRPEPRAASKTIVSEYTRIPFARGVLGMANAGKDTEGSEFFVTHSVQPHLDGRYTAFGRVVYGIEVIDRITTQDVIISVNLIGENLSS